jgi:hypothetical protein
MTRQTDIAYSAAVTLLTRRGVPEDIADRTARQIGAVVGVMPRHDLTQLVDLILPRDGVAYDIRSTLARPAPSRPVIAAAVKADAAAIVNGPKE